MERVRARARHRISTSHGSKHDEALRVLRSEPLDVLQITCNMNDQSAEPLMDLAAERGLAVVINRPLDGGSVFDRTGGRPLPASAVEAGCSNWPQFFLKWVISHPAVACAIPATRQPLPGREHGRRRRTASPATPAHAGIVPAALNKQCGRLRGAGQARTDAGVAVLTTGRPFATEHTRNQAMTTTRLNDFNQPIGAALPNWTPRDRPPRTAMAGRYCRIEPLDSARHAAGLYSAYGEAADGRDWTYLFVGPFADFTSFRDYLDKAMASSDPLHHTIIDVASSKAVGTAALMRIEPVHGVI
ncbi:MAG: hypothetical protein ABI831_26570, partial [Betaproteobacteria bacterium]